MPWFKHLVIKQCSELTMLPLNRLSLTALRDVEVLWSSSVSAKMLQELQVTFGFNLLIYPPMIDDLHEKNCLLTSLPINLTALGLCLFASYLWSDRDGVT
jgi:hypothetical protein